MHMPSVFKSLLFAASLLTALGAVRAQEVGVPKYNSPFSRFGVGDLSPTGYATQLGMGGLGQAYADAHIANPVNPASLAALRFATYQVGVNASRDQLSAGSQSNEGINGNLAYLSLAFTTRNTLNDLLDARSRKTRYATLLSVTPFSTQGYNIELLDDREDVGTVVNGFRGTGGFYQLRSGHALEIGKRLRVGAHLSYIFGRTNAQTSVGAAELPGASQVFDTESLRARGVQLTLGSQYDFVLKSRDLQPTHVLSLGGTVTLSGDLQGSGKRVITRENAFRARDTLLFLENNTQRIGLPNSIAGGVYYRVINKFSVGADLTYSDWSSFRNSQRPNERLTSGIKLAVGGEWTPDYQAYSKFHRIVRYRFGAYFEQDPRPGVDADRGVTLGFGLPVIRPREELSYVNLSLNAGSLATPGTIDQRYLRLTVGFALTDNTWFYKRRFK